MNRSTRADASEPRCLAVICHPVEDSFIRSAGARAIEALQSAGWPVEVIDLDGCGFRAVAELAGDGTEQRRLVELHRRSLRSVDELLVVYPTWYGAAPALLAGWLEQMLVDTERPVPTRGAFGNVRRVTVITSHGSSWPINFVQGESGRRFARRALRWWCNPLVRVKWVAFYGNDSSSHAQREAFIESVPSRVLGKGGGLGSMGRLARRVPKAAR